MNRSTRAIEENRAGSSTLGPAASSDTPETHVTRTRSRTFSPAAGSGSTPLVTPQPTSIGVLARLARPSPSSLYGLDFHAAIS